MKIALVSPYDFAYPGGVTEHVAALAGELQARGHQVHILAPCSKPTGRNLAQLRPVTRRVITISTGETLARIGVSPLSYFKIQKLLRQEKYNVVHLQEPLTPGLTWWTLLQVQPCPNMVTVGTFHAYHHQPPRGYYLGRSFLGKLFQKLDSRIAVSAAAGQFANRLFAGDYQIIPNGIDLNRFAGNLRPATQNRQTILFVGRPDRRKGFATLFEAFLRLKPAHPHLHLLVVGPFEPGLRRWYQTVARRRGVTDLTFAGYISPEQLPAYYHQADIFCAPALGFESFGIVLLEAMAAGLPVVASDIVGYHAIVTHNQEGMLVPPGHPTRLAEALAGLLQNPQQRRQMGQAGRNTAGQYSWNHVCDKIIEVYVNTLNRAASQPQAQPAPCARSTQRRQPIHVKRTGTQA